MLVIMGKAIAAASLLGLLSLTVTACAPFSSTAEYGDQAANERPLPEEYIPEEEPGWSPDESEIPGYSTAPTGWSCFLDPTMNYDWHDDVLCVNGSEATRPYLLEWMEFVTEDDLRAAAAEYEAQLNGS